MSDINVGDKVVYTGPGPNRQGEHIVVSMDGEPFVIASTEGGGGLNGALSKNLRVVARATYEDVPEPEPEWQDGDVVLDDDGFAFLRREPERWTGFSGNDYRSSYPERPLTLIARDGKPVTGGD